MSKNNPRKDSFDLSESGSDSSSEEINVQELMLKLRKEASSPELKTHNFASGENYNHAVERNLSRSANSKKKSIVLNLPNTAKEFNEAIAASKSLSNSDKRVKELGALREEGLNKGAASIPTLLKVKSLGAFPRDFMPKQNKSMITGDDNASFMSISYNSSNSNESSMKTLGDSPMREFNADEIDQ